MPLFFAPFLPLAYWIGNNFVDKKIDILVREGKEDGVKQIHKELAKIFYVSIFYFILNLSILLLFFLCADVVNVSTRFAIALAIIIILTITFIRCCSNIYIYAQYALKFQAFKIFTIIDRYIDAEVNKQVEESIGDGIFAKLGRIFKKSKIDQIKQQLTDYLKGELYKIIIFRAILLAIGFGIYLFMYQYIFELTTQIHFAGWYEPFIWAFKTVF